MDNEPSFSAKTVVSFLSQPHHIFRYFSCLVNQILNMYVACVAENVKVPGSQKFSQNFHGKPHFNWLLNSFRSLLGNAKRFEKLFWFCGWRIVRACAYYKIARMFLTLRRSVARLTGVLVNPALSHRTFGFRTQSNSFARLNSAIERNRTHKKKFRIQLNRTKEFD